MNSFLHLSLVSVVFIDERHTGNYKVLLINVKVLHCLAASQLSSRFSFDHPPGPGSIYSTSLVLGGMTCMGVAGNSQYRNVSRYLGCNDVRTVNTV